MLRKGLDECRAHPDPLLVPDYTEADLHAVRAWVNGHATEEQQKRSAAFVIETISRTYAVSFHPESDRLTSFAEGMRRVGQIIVYMANDAPTETSAAKIAARFIGRSKNND